MTLSEIETILGELVKRHPNLTAEMLTTLLLAAGWEDRVIKDTLTVFKQQHKEAGDAASLAVSQKVNGVPESTDAVTFFGHDGKEEGVLPTIVTIPGVQKPQTQGPSFFGALFDMFFGGIVVTKPAPSLPQQDAIQKPEVIVVQQPVRELSAPVEAKPLQSAQQTPQPLVSVEEKKPEVVIVQEKVKTQQPVVVSTSVPGSVSAPIPPHEEPKSAVVTQSVSKPEPVQAPHVQAQSSSSQSFFGALFHMFFGTTTSSSPVSPVLSNVEQGVPPIEKPATPPVTPVPEAPKIVLEEVSQSTPSPVIEGAREKLEENLVTAQVAPLSVPQVAPNQQSQPLHHEEMRQSLVHPLRMSEETKREFLIPDNLPLQPFESSEHVWSFSRYKEVFHGDEKKKEESKPLLPKEEVAHKAEVIPKSVTPEPEVEVVIEKTPISKSDESLVFLAGTMLLVIILILGYMYSHGRL